MNETTEALREEVARFRRQADNAEAQVAYMCSEIAAALQQQPCTPADVKE